MSRAGERPFCDRDSLDDLFSDYIGAEINNIMEDAGMHHLSQHEILTLSDDEKGQIYNGRGCAVERGIICSVERIFEELNLCIE